MLWIRSLSGLDSLVHKSRALLRCAFTIGASVAVTGCASFTAVQRPVTATDLKNQTCPTQDEVFEESRRSGVDRAKYRDDAIARCVKAINRNYADFKNRLHQESASANLFTDLFSQTLATFSAVDSGGTAKGLAASSALVAGGGKAINKNLFFDAGLPALEASMDAVRARALKLIVDAQNRDREANTYTLARAGSDLDALEAAGSLYSGLSELTQKATTAANEAKAELAESQQGRLIPLGPVVLLEDSIRARAQALTTKVRALKSSSDTAKLDQLIKALSIPVQPGDSFDTRKNNVVIAIVNSVMDSDLAKQLQKVSALEALLNPVLS